MKKKVEEPKCPEKISTTVAYIYNGKLYETKQKADEAKMICKLKALKKKLEEGIRNAELERKYEDKIMREYSYWYNYWNAKEIIEHKNEIIKILTETDDG